MSVLGLKSDGPVSWSKTGLIAYGETDSSDINLCVTFLETINGTNWRFHPPKKYIIHPHMYDKKPLSNGNAINGNGSVAKPQKAFYNIRSVHWNNSISLSGELLAVCDEVGNLTILMAGQSIQGPSTLDNMIVLFQDNIYKIHNQIIPLDEAVIGSKGVRKGNKRECHTSIINFQWLSSQKPVIVMLGARKDPSTDTFKSQVQQSPPYGIFHPTSIKSACIAIRRNGQLDFWYQLSNSKDHKKISLQLSSSQDPWNKEQDWLEFGQCAHMNEEQTMLIGVYSRLNRKFAFYKLSVNWNVNTANAINDPSLKLQHLNDLIPDSLGPNGEILQFNNFHITSRTHEKSSKPEILICYKVVGSSRSIVKRLEISTSVPSSELTLVFGTLTSNSSTSTPSKYTVKEVGGLQFDSPVSAVTSRILDSIIIFRLDNGETKVFNRQNWTTEADAKNVSSRGQPNTNITSLFCTGLQFPLLPPFDAIEWIKISPALGGVIAKLKFKKNPCFYSLFSDASKDEKHDSSIAAAFAYGFVVSNHRQMSGEDLSIAMKTHALKLGQFNKKRAERFITSAISSVYHLFGLSPDSPRELKDKLIMSRPIQRAMLLQLELGSSFINSNIYNISRVVMSLRNILFAFNGVSRNVQVLIHHTATMNVHQSNGKLFQFAFSKQDLIYSLIPCAKWFVKFITFLTQQMIVLVNNPNDTENTLVLGILSSKMTRTLILSVLNEMKKIIQLVTKFPETIYPVLNESSVYLRKVLGDSPVNFEKFETFLVDVNNKFIALSEQQPQLSSQKEPYLVVQGEIPEDIIQIKDFLLSYSNTAVLSHTKPADVYFTDTSGLRIFASEYFSKPIFKLLQPIEEGLVVDNETLPPNFKTARSFSVIEFDDISNDKLTSGKDAKIKRCCRCGSVTCAGYTVSKESTIVPTSISTKRWTNLYSKICVCSGFLYELH